METLYCIDKKGKIRVFKGDIGLSSPSQPNTSYIYTNTGTLGGNLIEKKITITKGKQRRSINEQAQFELESAYKEKRDEGYKSFKDLLSFIFTLNWSDEAKASWQTGGETSSNIIEIFNKLNIKFNSNKDWYLLPMLAEKWRDKKDKVQYPVLVQAKLNGVRALCFLNKQKEVTLMSRGGEYYTIPHIQKQFISYFNDFPDHIFDGEIYKHNIPLQVISGACRKEQLDLLEVRQSFLEYWIYDTPDLTSNQLSRDLNKDLRVSLLQKQYKSTHIKCVTTLKANREEDVLSIHNAFVLEGYEGCMVRDIESKYQFGFRDSCLLKVKMYQDAEFEIVDCEAKENIGESFVFILKNDINDLTFKARPMGTIKMKEYWYNNRTWLNKKATVRYQERSNDGLPIQGHVRAKESTILMENIREYGE